MVCDAMSEQAEGVRPGLTPVLDGSGPCLLHVRPRFPSRDASTDTEEHPS